MSKSTVSKTQMFTLLRLVDMGAGPATVARAQECWQALPAETRAQMCVRGSSPDMRRARLWAAAWEGAERAALARMEDLYRSLAEDGIVSEQPAMEWIEA
jgi:hypothetical protein